jgi:hypothetical protein
MRMIHSAYDLEFTQTCGGGSDSGDSSSSSMQNNEKNTKMKKEHATNKSSTCNNNKATIHTYEILEQMSNILEKLVSLLENTTNYYRTCFNEVMGFLKTSTSLHARLAAKMYLGDREFLWVTENMQVLKL